MGIANFTKWIECFDKGGEQWNEPFDSVWIDLQSELYVAIDRCFPLDDTYDTRCETQFFRDVSKMVRERLARLLLELFRLYPRREDRDEAIVMISFDGRGVPMKWPTQRKRRSSSSSSSSEALRGKQAYRVSLFGKNALSARVARALVRDLSSGRFHDLLFVREKDRVLFPPFLRYLVSGCDIPGEGEHKIFHAAEKLGATHPVFVSVDNDAFQLGFARLDRFECVQLYNGGGGGRRKTTTLYNLTHFVNEVCTCPAIAILYVSLLFGNDFLPPLVALTDANCVSARRAMSKAWDASAAAAAAAKEGWETRRLMPAFYDRFLTEMDDCLRYDGLPARTPMQTEEAAVRFWTTCFWVLDYYTRREFPQKRARNELFEAFDRDALLALVLANDHLERSVETFEKAREAYESMSSTEEEDDDRETRDREAVFDPESLKIIVRFFSTEESEGDGFCYDIKIATRKRKRGGGEGPDAAEKPPKRRETNEIHRRSSLERPGISGAGPS